MDMEIERLKKQYPKVSYVGIADGAKSNWNYLASQIGVEVLDFYHASQYLSQVASFFGQDNTWLDEACHQLKNKKNGSKKSRKQIIDITAVKTKRARSETVPFWINCMLKPIA